VYISIVLGAILLYIIVYISIVLGAILSYWQYCS
jgi:hypothetical protein